MRAYFKLCRRPQPEKTAPTYEEILRFDLQLAKWELENAYAGFDYAVHPDLIDCYIYKLNAAMKRYKYLLETYNALKKETLCPSVADDGLLHPAACWIGTDTPGPVAPQPPERLAL